MKINEYNEMMAYLTKPDKKPVIPKSKPKKSTREAYKEYLEIRPFLDAESQMFIEKELGFADGGRIGFDKGGMAKLVEYAKGLPKGTVLTRKMVEDYVKKNKLNVNIENFFNRKAPDIRGLKVDTSFTTGMLSKRPLKEQKLIKERIEKFGKSKYDKLSAENKYRVRLGEDVGKLAPEKQQKVKFKKAYDDAKKFYESLGIKFDDKMQERVRKSIVANEGKFVPPGKGAQIFKADTLKVVRDVFVNNPDADSTDIAKAIYGDKKFNAASLIEKEKMTTDASRQVPKFLQLFSPGSKETIKGFRDIKPEVLADILESIESRTGDFGFESGTRRELKFAIADAQKGLSERATVKAREKLLTKGKNVDEVVGVSSTFKDAPGYIEATQVIDKKINRLKGKTIDRDFNLAFKKALKGDYSLVENYNKKAKDFQKKYKVDTPIIRLGEDLNPKNFVAEFDKYSPGAQKNIMQVAKEKGIVIETKSSPLFSSSSKGVTLGANFANVTPEMLDFRKLPDDVSNLYRAASATAAKSPATLNALRKARAAAKFTGLGLAGEAAFTAPFALSNYAAGKSGKRILGDATYGLFGQTEKEELEDAAGELGLATQTISELGERLPVIQKQYEALNDQNDPSGLNRDKLAKIYNRGSTEYNNAYNLFVTDQGEFNTDLYKQAVNNYKAGVMQIQKFDNIAKQQRADMRTGLEVPDIDLNLFSTPIANTPAYDFAGGGIAKMGGVSSGPAPKSGPTPQGLDFLMKRGR